MKSMFKSSSDNRRIEENVYFNISVQIVTGQMADGELPNPNVVQTVLCTFPQKCVHLWDDTLKTDYFARASVETARSAGPTAPTAKILYASMFWNRNMASKAYSAAPNWFTHPTCRVKDGRVTLSWLRYARVWQILGQSLRATLICLPL